jgi:hypothetical protein
MYILAVPLSTSIASGSRLMATTPLARHLDETGLMEPNWRRPIFTLPSIRTVSP